MEKSKLMFKYILLGVFFISGTILASDFNDDNSSDILFKKDTGEIIVQFMNASGKAGQMTVAGAYKGWNPKEVADFDGNGFSDILLKESNGALRIQFFNMSGKSNNIYLYGNRGWSIEGTGDFNNDGNSDILFRRADGTLTVTYINGAGNTGQQFVSVDRGRTVEAVADFDGNGYADILFKESTGERVVWYMGTGGKLYNLLLTGSALSGWSVKGTGDFNHDGNSDVLFQKPDGTNLVWTMNSAGKLGKINITKTWDAQAIGDYNGDGDADILFKRPNGSLSILLMSGSGEIGSIFVMNDLGWTVLPAPSSCTLYSVNIGDTIVDTWTPTCESINRSGSYAQYYTFEVMTEQYIGIDLKSTEDTYMSLLEGAGKNGNIVEENDDFDGLNSGIYRVLSPGTYTIEATTYDSSVTGDFNISIVSVDMNTSGCTLHPLSLGGSVSGQWTTTCSSVNRPGSYAQYYSFEIMTEQNVTFVLDSLEDSFIYLMEGNGTNGTILEENDDEFGGGGEGGDFNAMIDITLAPGTYTIEATTTQSNRLGIFDLITSN